MAVVFMYDKHNEDCNKFEPIFESVAEYFRERQEEIRFFKMDIIHNDFEGMKVRGLPSLLITNKKWKEPYNYQKHFEREYLIDFLEHHLKEEIEQDL